MKGATFFADRPHGSHPFRIHDLLIVPMLLFLGLLRDRRSGSRSCTS